MSAAIGLVVLGAAFAAFYNVLTKRIQAAGWAQRTSALVALHQGGAAFILAVISAITGGPELSPGLWGPLVATAALNVVGLYGLMRARALEEVSLVTPIDALVPVFVAATSALLLGEYPSPVGWLGITSIAVGAYVLTIQDAVQQYQATVGGAGTAFSGHSPGRVLRAWVAPFAALGRSAGVRWALLTAFLFSISLNFDGLVARRADIGSGFAMVFGIAAGANFLVALVRREFHGLRLTDLWRAAAGPMFLFALWNYFTNWAFQLSIVPYVGALKRLQIPLTILLAYLLLGERKSFAGRFAGGLIMGAGVLLIYLGRT